MPVASIVITTRNRKADVLRALQSCYTQSYAALEVLVFDDASNDGTPDAIADQYPQVRLFRERDRQGYIVLRNRGFREALGKYVFSIDDDAYYTHPDTIEPVIRIFERSPEIAAIAMSYVEPGQGNQDIVAGDGNSDVRTFVGCAHALRKAVVLELGGYREFLVHQGEERDLCIRLLDRGHRIARVDTPPIVHCVSPMRDHFRLERYAIRNTLLFDILNIPLVYALPRLALDAVRLLTWMPSWPMSLYRVGYVLTGLASSLKYISERKAVSIRTYRHYRSLPLRGPQPWTTSIQQTPMESESCSYTN